MLAAPKKSGMSDPNTSDDREQEEQRDRVVDPALGQDLAEKVIGHVAVAPARDPV